MGVLESEPSSPVEASYGPSTDEPAAEQLSQDSDTVQTESEQLQPQPATDAQTKSSHTPEQADAIREYKAENGRIYKGRIEDCPVLGRMAVGERQAVIANYDRAERMRERGRVKREAREQVNDQVNEQQTANSTARQTERNNSEAVRSPIPEPPKQHEAAAAAHTRIAEEMPRADATLRPPESAPLRAVEQEYIPSTERHAETVDAVLHEFQINFINTKEEAQTPTDRPGMSEPIDEVAAGPVRSERPVQSHEGTSTVKVSSFAVDEGEKLSGIAARRGVPIGPNVSPAPAGREQTTVHADWPEAIDGERFTHEDLSRYTIDKELDRLTAAAGEALARTLEAAEPIEMEVPVDVFISELTSIMPSEEQQPVKSEAPENEDETSLNNDFTGQIIKHLQSVEHSRDGKLQELVTSVFESAAALRGLTKLSEITVGEEKLEELCSQLLEYIGIAGNSPERPAALRKLILRIVDKQRELRAYEEKAFALADDAGTHEAKLGEKGLHQAWAHYSLLWQQEVHSLSRLVGRYALATRLRTAA